MNWSLQARKFQARDKEVVAIAPIKDSEGEKCTNTSQSSARKGKMSLGTCEAFNEHANDLSH